MNSNIKRKKFTIADDPVQYVLRRDLNGGMNTRQFEQVIGENQAVLLQNSSCSLFSSSGKNK
jgi:hypothetical protein